ncbi:glycosyltransferase family 2 protein [Polynucleobacter sp.]|uniref:glycosyltransferase family 2 protein n=1 Tax=Polynucleobacter sp. TaxID=2029855 RepID=UPI0033417567
MTLEPLGSNPIQLSVVIPAYNEELVIQETLLRISRLLIDSKISHEIIIVDDGSSDETVKVAASFQSASSIRILSLRKNSGHMIALTLGMSQSRGEYVASIDADLQDPPEHLVTMYKILTGDNQPKIDVVQAFRADRSSDNFLKRITAGIYYKLTSQFTGLELIPHAADYRMMTKSTATTLVNLPESKKVFRLLIPKLGFRVYPLPITRDKRFAGVTKYSFSKMLSLATDSIVSFSFIPLRFFALFGIVISILSFILGILFLILYWMGSTVPGWPSLALLILSFNSLLFAGLGFIGEYIGRIYELVQNRPMNQWEEIEINPESKLKDQIILTNRESTTDD